jgi:hypothetical protein
MSSRLSVPISILIFLTACSNPVNDRVGNPEKIKEELEARKIKRITPAEITTTAEKWGKSNTEALQKNLNQVLGAELEKGALLPASELCNPDYLPVTDSLRKNYNTQVKWFSLNRKNKNLLHPKEQEILDAYQYNIEKKLPIASNLQKMTDTLFLYTTPVLLSEDLCLRCHGKVGKDIAETDYKKLAEKYPEFKNLTNIEKNKPIGIWGLHFLKAEVISQVK